MKISELCNFLHFSIRVHRIEPSCTIYMQLTVIRGQNRIVWPPFIPIIQVMIRIFSSFAESPTFRLPLRSTDLRFAGFTFDYAFFVERELSQWGVNTLFTYFWYCRTDFVGLIDSIRTERFKFQDSQKLKKLKLANGWLILNLNQGHDFLNDMLIMACVQF